jgi:hypothetical protein
MGTKTHQLLANGRATVLALALLLGLARVGFAFSMGYHYDLIREVMRKEGFSRDAFCVALVANSYTDIFQEEAAEWVIDDDFCRTSLKPNREAVSVS